METVQTVSVQQMRELDAYTIANVVDSKTLMYRAAEGVYNSFDQWADNRIAILCGGGNNGGDGYALAGILSENGLDPTIVQISEKLSEDGRFYFEKARDRGVKIVPWSDVDNLSSYTLIVDCILGTGFKGEVRSTARSAIEAVNASDAAVISVDINSGMDGDTGNGTSVVRSDLTVSVSVGYIKTGMVTGPAKKWIGKLVNVDIGIVPPDTV